MNNLMGSDEKARARLVLISMPLMGSVFFAVSSLIGNDVWQVMAMIASSFLGALGLMVGLITMIYQITRNKLNLRNVVVFGALYLFALFVFLASCTAWIDDINSSDDNHRENQPASDGDTQEQT